MIHGHVNYIAILTAAIAGMAIGFVWFSPALFGNLWMRIIGADKLTREELGRRQQEVKPYFAVMFIGTLISSAVLAKLITWTGAISLLGGGLRVAVWVWIGFALPYALGEAIFGGRDKDLLWPTFFVQAGHRLVALLVMGAILGVWR